MIHPEMSNVAKSQIKAKLANMFKSKEENISIFGLKTKFGGGRSTGFALIYDSNDARKKYDSKKMLRRVIVFLVHIFIRMDSLLDQSLEESKERKSKEESRKSEVSLRQRLLLLVERRSEVVFFTAICCFISKIY